MTITLIPVEKMLLTQTILWIALFTTSVSAAIELEVLTNYDGAQTKEAWKKVGPDQVPKILLSKQLVQDPVNAFIDPFGLSYFQDNNLAVCYKDCNEAQPFRILNAKLEFSRSNRLNVLEESNVYYWLHRYYEFIDTKFNQRPENFLKVVTNRDIKDEDGNKKLTNNAFFNPRDVSLSFLPARNNFFFKLLHGKINRSGFDPSVILHEASHHFFHQLFPLPMNEEIAGLNEGFADYMANIILENPRVGLVMLQGKALRDSSATNDKDGQPKIYTPKLESHALGERIALALWKTRELFDIKDDFDREVITGIRDLSSNPFSTIHDFKEIMLKRVAGHLNTEDLNQTEAIWEAIIPGNRILVDNYDFLKPPFISKTVTGFVLKQTYPKIYARDMGLPESESYNFVIMKSVSISPSQKAFLIGNESAQVTSPYWVVIDTIRSNILGVFSLDGRLIKARNELNALSRPVSYLNSSTQYNSDFLRKLRTFTALYQGDGDLKSVYRVTSSRKAPQIVKFNGSPVTAVRIEMDVKEKMLSKVLGDLPDIRMIALITIPVKDIQIGQPELMDHSVIGYKLEMKNGMIMEVIMDRASAL